MYGLIGYHSSGKITDIKLDDINIIGNAYVGGMSGQINTSLDTTNEITNIIGNNITILGNSNYVGGIIGKGPTSSEITIQNIKLENSNITGTNYTGGIIGEGRGSYIESINNIIRGESYVGGLFGNNPTGIYLINIGCQVVGNGSYIGGISGGDGGDLEYVVVSKSSIQGATINSDYVGGINGLYQFNTIKNFQINDVNITTNGKYVGGVVGSGLWFWIYDGYIQDTVVEGENYVGGVVGDTDFVMIRDISINANIKANSYVAGCVIGYLDNTLMTASYYNSSIYRVLVLDSTIESPTKAGGLIGDIATEIYRNQSFFNNNYVDADITSENESTGSLIIGGRPDENPYITNTYVYKYSTLNGDYVYATNDNIEDEQYLVRSDLENQSTYSMIGLGTTHCWDYTSLQEGKYPKIKDSYLYYPELQVVIELPTDPSIVDLNAIVTDDKNDTTTTEPNSNDISIQSVEGLPEVKVYPVSVNEINIDFSRVSDGVSFTYYINGQEIETIDLSEKTYTFKYNYIDEIEIIISNGVDEENITIKPSDVRSEISLVGSDYAYLIGNNLYINGEALSGEYVNVYSGYALSNSGQVIDILSGEIVENGTVKTALEELAKPLQTYEYKGSSIELYGTYSKIDENIKLQIYNVRSGKLSALSNSLDMKINNLVVDNYNDKEYQTILTNSGEIVDLKEGLNYPSNFLSRNVKQIVQNSHHDNTEMMVLYNTGKVIVFNYVNGNIIYENSEQADSNLANYITGSINSIWSDYESKQSEYLRSKALIARLAEMPIEEVLENKENIESNTNLNNSIENINNINIGNINDTDLNTLNTTITSNNTESYITVYNGETGEYEVYSESEILEGSEEMPVSETEKIKENGLEGIYNYEQEEETTPQVNGALIVASIIVIAIISLIVLRKLIYRNNQNSTKK